MPSLYELDVESQQPQSRLFGHQIASLKFTLSSPFIPQVLHQADQEVEPQAFVPFIKLITGAVNDSYFAADKNKWRSLSSHCGLDSNVSLSSLHC